MCQAKARVKPFPHACLCWEVQQYHRVWNCAPVTQKHIILIVLVGLWGFLHAMTSFDQTAVEGSSGLQRGENNPTSKKVLPWESRYKCHLRASKMLVFTRATKEFVHTRSFGFSSFLESAPSTWQRWHDYVCIFFLAFHNILIRLSDAATSAGPRSLCAGWKVFSVEEHGRGHVSWARSPETTFC